MKGCAFFWVLLVVPITIVTANQEKRLLENDANYVESRLHQMDLKIQQLTAQLVAKDQDITQLTNRLNQKDLQIKNITDDMALLKSGMLDKQVAFAALLNHDQTLGAQQIIRYTDILANVGNAYDPTSGIFVVPVDGIYSLSASMMGSPSNGIHLQLMKNGVELVRLWTQGDNTYELASHTLNVHLSKDDKIWVQNLASGDPVIYGKEKYNMFSAALLHPG